MDETGLWILVAVLLVVTVPLLLAELQEHRQRRRHRNLAVRRKDKLRL